MKYSLFAQGNHDGKGILWPNLSEEQKEEVAENFYGRDPIRSELTDVYYHFTEDGRCKFAD